MKTTWVYAAPRYSRALASDVISPTDHAASTAYPGSHRIITRKMVHYYYYYFIFPPLQRSPEDIEKQKIRQININKSSGCRERPAYREYPKMERAIGEASGTSEEGKKGRHKRKRKRIRGKRRKESERRRNQVTDCRSSS